RRDDPADVRAAGAGGHGDHRRGRQRRRARPGGGRPGADLRRRHLLGDQPGRLRGDPVERRRCCAAGGRGGSGGRAAATGSGNRGRRGPGAAGRCAHRPPGGRGAGPRRAGRLAPRAGPARPGAADRPAAREVPALRRRPGVHEEECAMTSDTARLSVIPQLCAVPGPALAPATGTTDALRSVQDSALGLLAGLDRPPRSLRIRTDRVELELEWPDPGQPAAGAAPAAATTLVAGPEDLLPPLAGVEQFITAQVVGVFYRSREPGAEPFVHPGDVVRPGQKVGIIEAMKLMSPVEADLDGRVLDALAADGTPVEYGDRLFAVEPDYA